MYWAVIVAPCNKLQSVVLYFSSDRVDNHKLVAKLLGLNSLLEYERKLEDEGEDEGEDEDGSRDEDGGRDDRCELFVLPQELIADKLIAAGVYDKRDCHWFPPNIRVYITHLPMPEVFSHVKYLREY